MKRFSAREFALLCLPVAVVAGVGFWAARHRVTPPPSLPELPPKLHFSSRPPTTLEAFNEVKTVLVAQVGEDVRGKEYGFRELNPLFWLKIGDGKDSQIWRNDGAGSMPKNAFSPSVLGNASINLPLKNIPQKPIVMGLKAEVVSLDLYQPTQNFEIKGQWQVDKSQIKPFDFSLDKAPLTHMREMGIFDRDANSITFEVEFTFDKAGENHDTPFEAQVQERHGRLKWQSVDGLTPSAPQNWESIIFKVERSPSSDLPFEITGRVSANNRWPLAFKMGPFKFDEVKVGRPIPFKTWLAPLPPHADK